MILIGLMVGSVFGFVFAVVCAIYIKNHGWRGW